MSTLMKKMLIGVSIFFIILFGIYGVKQLVMSYFLSRYRPPPVTISAATVKSVSRNPYISTIGTLTAVNGVDLSPAVPGIIAEIRFNSGQYVKQGEVLIVIDTRLEQAELKNNEAKLKLAKMDYAREKKLFDRKVSSQAALDTRLAELQEAEAQVEATLAKIQQKTITAPFSGKIGICLVNIGQYVSPGTPMVTLQSLNPLFVRFNLPERYLSLLTLNQRVSFTINDGRTNKIIDGKITAINAKVDTSTRNIMVQATIQNNDFKLFPGMFALSKIWLQEQKNVLVIPETAISYSLSGDYIFVLKKDTTKAHKPIWNVFRHYIKTGERRDGLVAIEDGLKLGQQVVTAGQLKLQDGSQVLIDQQAGNQ